MIAGLRPFARLILSYDRIRYRWFCSGMGMALIANSLQRSPRVALHRQPFRHLSPDAMFSRRRLSNTNTWNKATLQQPRCTARTYECDLGNGETRNFMFTSHQTTSGTWTPPAASAPHALISPATLLPNGKVLVGRRIRYHRLTASAELYDPASGTWTATGSLNTAHCVFTRRCCCLAARCSSQVD